MAKLALFKTDAQRKAAARRTLKAYGAGKHDNYGIMYLAEQFGWVDPEYTESTNKTTQRAIDFLNEIAGTTVKRNPRGVFGQNTKPRYTFRQRTRAPKGVLKNPRERSYKKAVSLYRDFTGENPRHIDDWEVTVPDVAMEVGKVTGIIYKAHVDGRVQEFMHEFTGTSRPTLAASSDGRQLLLLGGDYKMTERGIVDGTYEFVR